MIAPNLASSALHRVSSELPGESESHVATGPVEAEGDGAADAPADAPAAAEPEGAAEAEAEPPPPSVPEGDLTDDVIEDLDRELD